MAFKLWQGGCVRRLWLYNVVVRPDVLAWREKHPDSITECRLLVEKFKRGGGSCC